jgi:hypothetical protein
MAHRRDLPTQIVHAIKAEIETGRTFASLALSSGDQQKTARNTANARKAYDTARVRAETALLNPTDSKEIADQLELLKADVAKLEKPSKPSG